MNENQQVGTPDISQVSEPQVAQQQQEKLLPQTQVNALVGSAKQKGYEKGQQDALAHFTAQQAQAPHQTIGLDAESARKIAEETFAKQHQALVAQQQQQMYAEYANKVLSEVDGKMKEARSRTPDYDSVVNLKDFQNAPEILDYANNADNAGDVLYELAKNPGKLANIKLLHISGMPDHARLAIKQISDSVKTNQAALQQPKSPAPFNQIKPSSIGLGNGADKSVSDLRNDPSYRG